MKRIALLVLLFASTALAQTPTATRAVITKAAAQFTGTCVTNSVGKAYDTGAEYCCVASAWTLCPSVSAASSSTTVTASTYLAVGADTTYQNMRIATFAKAFSNASSTCLYPNACQGGWFQSDHTGDGTLVDSNADGTVDRGTNQDGWFFINRIGSSGAGGSGQATSVALGGYQELRGSATGYPSPSYGNESAVTLYNTGSLTNGTGVSGSCQTSNPGNGTITNCYGVAGVARSGSSSTLNATDARGVYGKTEMLGSGTIATGYGGVFEVLDSGPGSINTAAGVSIGAISAGGTNNYGLVIGAVSGGSNLNCAQRLNGTTSGYVCLNPTAAAGNANLFYPATSGTLVVNDSAPSGALLFKACSDTASAATITADACNMVTITGSTGITAVNTCNAANKGRELTILCGTATAVITDGSNLKLAGNFTCTADDSITLLCDGTNWIERSRSAN